MQPAILRSSMLIHVLPNGDLETERLSFMPAAYATINGLGKVFATVQLSESLTIVNAREKLFEALT